MQESVRKNGNRGRVLQGMVMALLCLGTVLFLILFLFKNHEVQQLQEKVSMTVNVYSTKNEELRKKIENLQNENEKLRKKNQAAKAEQEARGLNEKLDVVIETAVAIEAELEMSRQARQRAFDAQQLLDVEGAKNAALQAHEAAERAKEKSNETTKEAQVVFDATETILKATGITSDVENLARNSDDQAKIIIETARLQVLTAEVSALLADVDAGLAEAQIERDKVMSAENLDAAKAAARQSRLSATEAGENAAKIHDIFEKLPEDTRIISGKAKNTINKTDNEGESTSALEDDEKTNAQDAPVEEIKDANVVLSGEEVEKYIAIVREAAESADSQVTMANAAAEAADASLHERENPSYTTENILASAAGTTYPEEAIDMANVSAYFRIYEISRDGEVFARINGKSYRDNPEVALEQLRYLKVLHRNYNGKIQVGEMICNVEVANDVLEIFRGLFEQQYQIYSMFLVDNFWTGDGLTTDEASVRENNTSCFNYRRASDAANLSIHAYGKAVDVNPRDNPYVVLGANGWYTDPHIDYAPGEEGYISPDTRVALPHAMNGSDPCVLAFKARGFSWGGDWGGASRDFQHFVR